ncbi:hypothetical protein [Streptosporangium canum]|uniref:hypothetical protein n=1 Tax=Streptosporangium canum TaxID=324952 RepID=UPI0037977A84
MSLPNPPEITNMTVEIRVLKVGGKQVTLSLFKQLREEPLISHEGTLNGTPWGIVNHHPDKCEPRSTLTHQHLVWISHAGELLRYSLYNKPTFDWPSNYTASTATFVCEAADRLLISNTHEWIHGRLTEPPLRADQHTGRTTYRPDLLTANGDLKIRADASEAAMNAAHAKRNVDEPFPAYAHISSWPSEDVPAQPDPRAAADCAALDEAIAILDAEVAAWGISRAQVMKNYQMAITAEKERRQRHRELHISLAAVPQLFIGA